MKNQKKSGLRLLNASNWQSGQLKATHFDLEYFERLNIISVIKSILLQETVRQKWLHTR